MKTQLSDEICVLKRAIVKKVHAKRGVGISNRRLARIKLHTDLGDFSVSPRLLKIRAGARRVIKGLVSRFRVSSP